MKNSDAERLLAQARILVQAQTQRRRYILEETLLGKCVAHVDDLRMTTPQTIDLEDSWPPDDKDMVEVLTEAISAGVSYKIAFALGRVLNSIVDELEQRSDGLLELGPTYDLSKVN